MVAAVSAPTVAERIAAELVERMGGERSERFDQTHVTLAAARIREAVRHARTGGLEHLSDVMGIDWLDYPGHAGPRFTVVYNLYALADASRLMLRVNVDEDEPVPSITPQWKGAGFFEREVYDLFGIEFEGHPDLRKLVTPDDLDGHPLRKDFPLGETPTLFNDGRFLDPASFRAGMMGQDRGRTGWVGGARKGVRSEQGRDEGGDA
jgi:NADH-quinone oxidoreductase subunit C